MKAATVSLTLRPGAYTVDFSLPGFRTDRQDGLELNTGFIANVNAKLAIGAIEETITVTSAAPIVDVQGIVQQHVFSRETAAARCRSARTQASTSR